MSYTYAEYFDILDYELKQVSEGGDYATDDSYRLLPSSQAKRVIDESIHELVLLNPDRFEQELTVTFKDSPDPEDIEEATSGSTYTAPDQVAKIISAKVDCNWFAIGDSSDLNSTIYSTSNKTITNANEWEENDTITFKAIVFPATSMTTSSDITSGSTVLTWPNEYIRLLTLDVKKKVYSRQGKGLSQFEYSEYMELKNRWSNEKGRVRKVSRVAFRGYGFGRR
jgi:hypothetical protein